MPVLEGYVYADTPHEKTVAKAGYVYGCHSSKAGPRGGDREYVASSWSANGSQRIETSWLPISCGHTLRVTDPACTGCANREE